jgi:hypothetical protein
MSSRFIPVELFRGHWKGLSDYRGHQIVPDNLSRAILIAVPLLAGASIFLLQGTLAAPGSLLAGVALLAGGFLAAFGQISTLRLRLTDRAKDFGEVEAIDRDALDETAAHLLVASFMSAVTALVLVLGMNLGANQAGVIWGFWAALAVVPATYVLLVFVIAIPRLYAAYVNINKVRDQLSGTYRGKG